MASTIMLGGLFGRQFPPIWDIELNTSLRGLGSKAIIAKGNIIAGIEAQT